MYSLQWLQLWMKIWNKEKNTDLTWELRTWNCPFPCLGLGPQHSTSVTCKASYMFTKFSTADSDDVYERLKEYWDTHYLLREVNIRDQVSKAVLSWHCYTVPEPISPLQVPTKSVSDQWTSLAPAWRMKGRDCRELHHLGIFGLFLVLKVFSKHVSAYTHGAVPLSFLLMLIFPK